MAIKKAIPYRGCMNQSSIKVLASRTIVRDGKVYTEHLIDYSKTLGRGRSFWLYSGDSKVKTRPIMEQRLAMED